MYVPPLSICLNEFFHNTFCARFTSVVNFLLNLRNILDLKKNCKFYILISVYEMAW